MKCKFFSTCIHVFYFLIWRTYRYSRMIGGSDILRKVMVLYGNIWEKITGSVAKLEHSRRMLSHARRVYLEAYVRVSRYDIDKHEVVKCVFGAYMEALR